MLNARRTHVPQATSTRFDLQALRRRAVRRAVRMCTKPGETHTRLPRCGIHRILVLRPNHRLGNTVLLTPLLAEIERLYPGAEVDLLCAGEASREVFAEHGMVRHLWVMDRWVMSHPLRFWRTLHRLRRQSYDLAIDPCVGSQSGRLLLGLSRATHKIGFADAGASTSLTFSVPPPEAVSHLGQLPVHLLRCGYGLDDVTAFPPLDIRLRQDEQCEGRHRLRQLLNESAGSGPVVALFGDATGAKLFADDWWRQMTQRLLALRPDVRLIEIAPASAHSRFADSYPVYFSSSIRRMAAVMSATDLVISADCGVMHLAAASGVMTAGIFKVTRPAQYAPYGRGSFSMLAEDGAPGAAAEALDRLWCATMGNVPIRAPRHGPEQSSNEDASIA